MRKFIDIRQCVRAGSESRKGDESFESACRTGRLRKADQSPSESSGQGKGDPRARCAFTDRAGLGGNRRVILPEL